MVYEEIIKKYRCEKCHTTYGDKANAEACERGDYVRNEELGWYGRWQYNSTNWNIGDVVLFTPEIHSKNDGWYTGTRIGVIHKTKLIDYSHKIHPVIKDLSNNMLYSKPGINKMLLSKVNQKSLVKALSKLESIMVANEL